MLSSAYTTHTTTHTTQVQQQKQNWKQFHKELTSGLQPGQSVDLGEFLWALQAVRSRCFSGPYSGAPLRTKLTVGVPTAIAAVVYVVTQVCGGGGAGILVYTLVYTLYRFIGGRLIVSDVCVLDVCQYMG